MDSFMAHFNCIQLFSMSWLAWQKWLGGTSSRSGDIPCIKMLDNNEDRMQITNNCSSHSGPRPSQRLWCTIRPALLAEAFILLIRALEQRALTSNRNCPFIQIMDGPSCKGGVHGMGGFDGGRFFWIQSRNIPNRNTRALLQLWWFLLAQQSKLCGFPWEEIKQELTSATVTALWNWSHLSLREISNHCSGIFWLSSWENHLKISYSRPDGTLFLSITEMKKTNDKRNTGRDAVAVKVPRNLPRGCGPAVTQLSWRFH